MSITHDPHMKPENVLCTHPHMYPYFEMDVVPGTDWEIEEARPGEFYAYRWNDEDCQMNYILDEGGFDKVFTSRDAALAAIQTVIEEEQGKTHG